MAASFLPPTRGRSDGDVSITLTQDLEKHFQGKWVSFASAMSTQDHTWAHNPCLRPQAPTQPSLEKGDGALGFGTIILQRGGKSSARKGSHRGCATDRPVIQR